MRYFAQCSLFLTVCLLCLDLSTIKILATNGEKKMNVGSGSAFVGWEGATYNPKRTWGRNPVDDSKLLPQDWKDSGSKSAPTNSHRWYVQNSDFSNDEMSRVEQLSWKPRSYVFHNFLTEKECEHLKDAARPLLTRSTVVGATGYDVDPIRTSFGTFLPRCADSVIEKIEQKVANWTHLPLDHQEDIQILRYGYKQHYGAHTDSLENDTPRLATVLIYLADVEEGGETSFVKSWNWLRPEQAKIHGPFSECAQGHVSSKPKKGDALLFYSLTPNGELDELSMHAGCPVLKGTKWTATFWIHNQPFRRETLLCQNILRSAAVAQYFEDSPEPVPDDPGKCVDKNSACPIWKNNDECTKNSGYMKDNCPASCGVCKKCAEHDHLCYAENRKRAGYPKIEDLID